MFLEGNIELTARGEVGLEQGGVLDHGTYEEDDRVTWETLTPPRTESGGTERR